MIIKTIILTLLVLILISLAASLFSFIGDRENKHLTAKLLTVRVTLSVLLFLFLGLAFFMGWIQPHALMPTRP